MCQKVMGMQIALSALKKDILWAQTVRRKIFNQGCVAKKYNLSLGKDLVKWSKEVKRGDPCNLEAQAARAYFTVFTMDEMRPFHRSPTGPMPNSALNYGYAILRAAVARALVSSGLNCMIGIHHHNQYDPYCLADDIMEPYRPFVDMLVLENYSIFEKSDELTPEMKRVLLGLLVMDVEIGKMRRPLMNALTLTAASIVRVISGSDEEIEYPKV
jgi:CRISPR-associated protein Cas1